MTAPSRTAQFAKVHKILKRHYKPLIPDGERPVLEHLLFACCLEDARTEAAEEAFASLVESFFDFNEIRVSSIRELAEVLHRLPDPAAAAIRLKRVLQQVFEANYSFDLEELRKKNLGAGLEHLSKLEGVSRFAIAYVVQSALGGHAIPVSRGGMRALHIVGLVGDDDLSAHTVPGLERAISKSKGPEFASLLNQLGAELTANPYGSAVREILTEINPEARDRLPRRRRRPAEKAGAAPAEASGPSAPAPAKPPPKSNRGKKANQGAAAAEQKKQEKAPEDEAPRRTSKPKPKPAAESEKSSAAEAKKPAAKRPSGARERPAQTPPKESERRGALSKSSSASISKRKPR